jgi:hypothetical protein
VTVHRRSLALGDFRELVGGDQRRFVAAFPHRLQSRDVISGRGR